MGQRWRTVVSCIKRLNAYTQLSLRVTLPSHSSSMMRRYFIHPPLTLPCFCGHPQDFWCSKVIEESIAKAFKSWWFYAFPVFTLCNDQTQVILQLLASRFRHMCSRSSFGLSTSLCVTFFSVFHKVAQKVLILGHMNVVCKRSPQEFSHLKRLW